MKHILLVCVHLSGGISKQRKYLKCPREVLVHRQQVKNCKNKLGK